MLKLFSSEFKVIYVKQVDIKAVAALHQINVGAASKRLSRLRQAQESRGKQDREGSEGAADDDMANTSPKTPKAKGKKATAASAPKTIGTKVGAITPTTAPKGKKRKLSESKQVDALLQQAGVEARAKMDGKGTAEESAQESAEE